VGFACLSYMVTQWAEGGFPSSPYRSFRLTQSLYNPLRSPLDPSSTSSTRQQSICLKRRRGVGRDRWQLFARRQSFWDALFMLMDSRSDDSVVGFFLKWFVTFLLNFTIGLVTSLITFVIMVYDVVFSYSPDPLSGTRPPSTHTSR
jgi:hypothetical protein